MRLDRLAHPAPLGALLLLLLNDFALKALFPGALTGKLSDFAGLYLFTIFWIAVFPRSPRRVAGAVALGWVVWKTPVSGPLITAWNATSLPSIGRVPDLTDLLALAVLPLALIEPTPIGPARVRRLAAPAMAMLSVFAFAATSVYRPPYNLPGEYILPLPADQVLARIHALRLDYSDDGVPPAAGGPVSLRLPPGDSLEAARGSAWDFPVANFEVVDAPEGSVVHLREVYMSRIVARDSVRAWFERRVLERIRRNQANPFPRPPVVSGADALFRPRVLAPTSLAEARGRVTIRLARSASVALIEVSPRNEWRLIYPVATDDERMLPAGGSTLTTLCATTKVRGDYGPRDAVPPCGVAVPVTPATAAGVPRAGQAAALHAPQETAVGVGRLILLAADAPLSRSALESALADPAFPKKELVWPEVQSALGRLIRQGGGRRAAASETLLRR